MTNIRVLTTSSRLPPSGLARRYDLKNPSCLGRRIIGRHDSPPTIDRRCAGNKDVFTGADGAAVDQPPIPISPRMKSIVDSWFKFRFHAKESDRSRLRFRHPLALVLARLYECPVSPFAIDSSG